MKIVEASCSVDVNLDKTEYTFTALPKVAVHDGLFHLDDVLSVAILTLAHPEVPSFFVHRTRKTKELNEMEFRMDVGGAYTADRDFDHHQAEFGETWSVVFDNKSVTSCKMAAAGLMWAKFGHTVIRNTIKHAIEERSMLDQEIHVDFYLKVWDDVACTVIVPSDMNDTGQASDLGESAAKSLAQVIAASNELDIFGPLQHYRFEECVRFVCTYLCGEILHDMQAYLDERDILAAAKVAQDGIMVFNRGMNWKPTVGRFWSDFDYVKVIVFPSGPQWMIQNLPANSTNWQSRRCPAPEAWRGKSGQALKEVTGIPAANFCHATGFLGAASSRDGALEMANKWVTEVVNQQNS